MKELTCAPLPWTIRQSPAPVEGFPTMTDVLDRSGNFIGAFFDHRDADRMLSGLAKAKESEAKLDAAETEIEHLKQEIDDLRGERRAGA